MSDLDPNLPPETDPVPPVTKEPEQPPAEPTAEELLRKKNEELEKKFAASTSENQNLQARLRVEEAARQESTKEPTDSELRTAFPSWENYDETQKEFARRTFAAERTASSAKQIATQLQSDREWNTSVELALTSDPALQGKEQAFRQYASKPQYKNVPMDVLVSSFLQKQGTPVAPKTTPKPGLEPGSGGPRTPEKPKTLSADDLTRLRTTDEKAYMEYVKTHPIDVDNL